MLIVVTLPSIIVVREIRGHGAWVKVCPAFVRSFIHPSIHSSMLSMTTDEHRHSRSEQMLAVGFWAVYSREHGNCVSILLLIKLS
jgi:hypothetical protein